MSEKPIVIGVGNLDRGDDAAGRIAAQRLRASGLGDVDIVEHDGEATALLARLEKAGSAYLIDACRSGASPGAIHRFDVRAASLPSALAGVSSHGFGLAAAIELARALDVLPRRCVVYAIEGARFDAGAPLSDPVSRAVDAVVAELVSALSA